MKILSGIFLIWIHCSFFIKNGRIEANKRLTRVKRGSDLITIGAWSTFAIFAYIVLECLKDDINVASVLLASILPLLLLPAYFLIGVLKIATGARQVKVRYYIFLALFWWVPILNIFVIHKIHKLAFREYIIESNRLELDKARAENQICKTKYPILLVHGIFFRDWQLFNYWGRIPAAMIKNGAEIYYGKQQSSLSVEQSAEELKRTILELREKTGAKKFNIIAHSKGGLDARYAISRLGMDKYIASLTTIGTPHEGCDFVDSLLTKVPKRIQESINKHYNKIFKKLGDTKPNFLAGVNDLRASIRKEQNKLLPDMDGVFYQSYGSVMKKAKSAGFPLNVGFRMIKKSNGRNDGLVWEKSAKHGKFTLIEPKHRRGISHGDLIDLFRENIPDFDVRELYIDIAKDLKERNL